MYSIFEKTIKEKGLKTVDVAKATGIHKSTFSDWKSGKSIPKQDKMQKIANFLDIPVEYLMTGEKNILENSVILETLIENPDLFNAIKLIMAQDAKKQQEIIDIIKVMCK